MEIQTNGDVTPANALKEALKNLMEDIDSTSKKFGVFTI